LPELYCGFARKPDEPPVSYPVACLPQAWSSGAVFMLLKACLGLRINGLEREIYVDRPALPQGIDRIAITGIALGEARIDLVFQRLDDRIVAFCDGDSSGTVRVLMRG
jgi:glycogen debranching enzyme